MSLEVIREVIANLEPTGDPVEAVEALSQIYATYASDATASLPTPIPLLPAGLEAGRTAMAAALTGMHLDGAARVLIPLAVIAFWAAVAELGPLSFTGASLVTPPPHVTLSADLAAIFDYNVLVDVGKDEALNFIAEVLHENAILGGTITVATVVYEII